MKGVANNWLRSSEQQDSRIGAFSKDTMSFELILERLDLVQVRLQDLVNSSLSIANQLRLVEDLLLGKDLVT